MRLFQFGVKKIFNKAIVVLLFTNALVRLANGMLSPIYALFVTSIGGDILDASLTGGTYALVGGLVALISGRLADEMKESELMLVIGYIVMGLGYTICFFANNIPTLMLAQAFIGLGDAVYFPPFDALYSKHAEKKCQGVTWSMWESMNYLVTAAGAFIGGYLVVRYGFRTIFILMSMFCYFSGLYILLRPREEL